jgi:hypothetical protein
MYGIWDKNSVSNLNVIYCLQELRKTTIDDSQDSLRPFVIQRGISPNPDHIDKTCFQTEVRMMKYAQWRVPGHSYRIVSAGLLCSCYFTDKECRYGEIICSQKHDA